MKNIIKIEAYPTNEFSGNESSKVNILLDELKEYFDNTSEEQIKLDWEKSKPFDNIGPTVEEYFEETEKLNELKELERLKEKYG